MFESLLKTGTGSVQCMSAIAMSCCNTLQHSGHFEHTESVWVAVRCNKASLMSCCNALQHTATRYNTMRRTHCNILLHITTHCNALQHTATHCNMYTRVATYIAVSRDINLYYRWGALFSRTIQKKMTACKLAWAAHWFCADVHVLRFSFNALHVEINRHHCVQSQETLKSTFLH